MNAHPPQWHYHKRGHSSTVRHTPRTVSHSTHSRKHRELDGPRSGKGRSGTVETETRTCSSSGHSDSLLNRLSPTLLTDTVVTLSPTLSLRPLRGPQPSVTPEPPPFPRPGNLCMYLPVPVRLREPCLRVPVYVCPRTSVPSTSLLPRLGDSPVCPPLCVVTPKIWVSCVSTYVLYCDMSPYVRHVRDVFLPSPLSLDPVFRYRRGSDGTSDWS